MSELNGQTISPPVDGYVSMNSGVATIYLEVEDTTNVSEIEVVLNSQLNSDNIFENSYVFDQANGLQNGMTYSRAGNAIYLSTGQIQSTPVIFSKIRLKNLANNWSTWFEFVSN